ncbi:MAG TPA: thioredoxin domain-containing protein [Mycobacteriales bacterium]|nr:thioredoxin domain-containing protein [Mycobacteriales bacterium]
MANRLASATSPYLLQHADNPVDWYEWGPEAFAEAKRRDAPILLSVGYAACHWCHVMAHESFEDDATAAVINEHYVSIKVDREERPDVDAVYMDAVTATTGQGGWPMTCLLTPAGDPFFAGTYFPRPAFTDLLRRGAEVWAQRREEVVAEGGRLVSALAGQSAYDPARAADVDLDAAAARLLAGLDGTHGGFGGAPKFPPSMALEFLLRCHARSGAVAPLDAVSLTCERMARGGIYDQLAGGFARYSVDAAWVVPHFEKMLYDNALLARLYLHWWRQTGSPLGRRVALETCEFLVDGLGTPQGGFASALDADTGGVEGATYVWTPAQVGAYAAEVFAVTEGGSFEHETSVLQLPHDPADPERFAAERLRLKQLRAARPQPGRDDKVVTAWNGLAVAALAECGALLERPEWIRAAAGAADLLLRAHLVDGRLRRTSRDGVVGRHAGVLDDYALLADGLLVLHQVTGERRWLDSAGDLLETVLAHFTDPATGAFFDTADDAETLLRRPQDPTDNATPAGASAAAGALLTFAALTGSVAHRERAADALRALAPLAQGHPRFAGHALAVAEAWTAGPVEVAVVGRPDLLALARYTPSPGAVVLGDGDGPLLEGRPTGAAYVCRGFVCAAPTTEASVLAGQLGITAR